MFTKFLYDVEALMPLLTHAFTKHYCILFHKEWRQSISMFSNGPQN